MRQNIPTFNAAKAREVILYILKKLGPTDEGILYHILYHIDFDFYEKYENHMMGFTYTSHI